MTSRQGASASADPDKLEALAERCVAEAENWRGQPMGEHLMHVAGVLRLKARAAARQPRPSEGEGTANAN